MTQAEVESKITVLEKEVVKISVIETKIAELDNLIKKVKFILKELNIPIKDN